MLGSDCRIDQWEVPTIGKTKAAANASAVLKKAAVGIQCPFGSFAPHGGWHEGSM